MKTNIGKNFLQLSALFTTAAASIWEYVSNSLEYRDAPDGTLITVDIDNKKKTVTISDNGNGMNEKELESFFTTAGENLARKGKQASWMKRGKNGTGKAAAFGIGDELILETVQGGVKNKYKLTRSMLEKCDDDGSVEPESLIVNQTTNESNGTKIQIKGLNRKIYNNEVINKIEREISHLRNYDIKISVNDYLCEFQQLDIVRSFILESSGAVKERYGKFEAKVDISRIPLQENDVGIKILCNKNIIGIEDCGIGRSECGSLITGEVDIPELEKPIDGISPDNQVRDQKLNKNHKGVKELIFFLGPKLEDIRKRLAEEKAEDRNTAQAKKLTKITNDLATSLNKEWNRSQRQLHEIRTGTNSHNSNSIYFEEGNDSDMEAIIEGEEVGVEASSDTKDNRQDNTSGSGGETNEILNKNDDADIGGQIVPGERVRKRTAGFSVDHESLGEDEHRSVYRKNELKIVINKDHPSVKACLNSCNGDVENQSFKRLIFEIVFREFEHAVAQEMVIGNDNYPPSDLLFEMRAKYDKLARSIGQDIYKT